MANNNSTKVVTGPNVKMSYLHILEPASINGSDPKYSGSFLIPKGSPDVEKIRAALQELGLSETVRGEALSLKDFAALAELLNSQTDR